MQMKVNINPKCFAEIMYYVNKSTVEISGLGRVQKASDGTLVVTSVYLLDQENGPASTDIDGDAVAKLQFETRNDPGDLNFWWHSHVNMAAFWSGTDMATIEQFGKNGYLLATVFNKKYEYKTAYYQGSAGFLPQIFIDDITTEFEHMPSQEEVKSWEDRFTTTCKTRSWTTTGSYTSSAWDRGNYDDLDFGHTKMESMPDEHWIAKGWSRNASGFWVFKGVKPATEKAAGLTEAKPAAGEKVDIPEGPYKKKFSFTDIVGTSSGATAAELIKGVQDIRKVGQCSLSELDVTSTLILGDTYEILNGHDTDDENELMELLIDIQFSEASCKFVIHEIFEALDNAHTMKELQHVQA